MTTTRILTSYDYELSGGLSEEIERLTAPDNSSKKLKNASTGPNGKENTNGACLSEIVPKVSKKIIKECCDACGEIGDLVRCDLCAASFHLQCLNPPLTEKDLPSDWRWVCKMCNHSREDCSSVKSSLSDTSNTGRRKPKALSNGNIKESKLNGAIPGSNQSNGTTQSNGPVNPDQILPAFDMRELDQLTFKLKPTVKGTQHPLMAVTDEMKHLNPLQFSLPAYLQPNVMFPTDSKKKWRGDIGLNIGKASMIELENGLVPLPVVLCFNCRKSCRVGPLLQCDYCPLAYHLDCLNPPMTSAPFGKHWICPNHPEHFIDSNMLTTTSHIERVRLWQKYGTFADIDPMAVKLQFLRKSKRTHPTFVRHRKNTSPCCPSVIPGYVKGLYESRADDLPDVDLIEQFQKLQKTFRSESATYSKMTDITSRADKANECFSKISQSMSAAANRKRVDSVVISPILSPRKGSTSSTSEIKHSSKSVPKQGSSSIDSTCNDSVDGNNDEMMLEGLMPTRPAFPYPSTGQIPVSSMQELIETVLTSSKTGVSVDLSNVDPTLIVMLAKQRIAQMVPPTEPRLRQDFLSTSIRPSVIRSKNDQRYTPPKTFAALLYPLNSPFDNRPIPLRVDAAGKLPLKNNFEDGFTSLKLGSSKRSPLWRLFSRCDAVADHHATIFFDKSTQKFVVINYASSGTTVDTVHLSPGCPTTALAMRQSLPAIVNRFVNQSNAVGDETKKVGIKRKMAERYTSLLVENHSEYSCACGDPGEVDATECDNIAQSLLKQHEALVKGMDNDKAPPSNSKRKDDKRESAHSSPTKKAKHDVERNHSTTKKSSTAPLDKYSMAKDRAGFEGCVTLRHGSVIRIGCCQMLFCEVDRRLLSSRVTRVVVDAERNMAAAATLSRGFSASTSTEVGNNNSITTTRRVENQSSNDLAVMDSNEMMAMVMGQMPPNGAD